MLCYRPFELHTHTQHSDGQFTVPELMRAAKAYQYDGIALTDHNVVTAALDVTPALTQDTVMTLPGIEWTTFYGHLVVLGCDHFVDWRFVTPDTIDDALAEIRAAGGTAGIAHPCEVGSPLMCGCNWEFRVTRWDLVDYIEIWSAHDPAAWSKNALAQPWYDALLNEGHHLAVSAGRDWHAADTEPKLLTATYLGLEEGTLTQQAALAALRAGRTFVTLGPTVAVSLAQNGQTYSLGDTAQAGAADITVVVDEAARREVWQRWGIRTKTVRLVANGSILAERPFGGAAVAFAAPLDKGWLRIELYGDCNGKTEQLLAETSPIYLV